MPSCLLVSSFEHYWLLNKTNKHTNPVEKAYPPMVAGWRVSSDSFIDIHTRVGLPIFETWIRLY